MSTLPMDRTGLAAITDVSRPSAMRRGQTSSYRKPAGRTRSSIPFAQSNFYRALGFRQAQILLVFQLRLHSLPRLKIEYDLAECQLQLDDGKAEAESWSASFL